MVHRAHPIVSKQRLNGHTDVGLRAYLSREVYNFNGHL